ncbi:hydroxyethylthiazole kinase [Streptohalobacillus salinus]|uniref:Hydroxyethylthiazole kinase n=1 Tax=Streptohalobacillus salinus TaxID=621096 RepID=A0A2V3W8B7_9BACI|nr:hydroxyethylthiazole kinase [Streptohalobacillus salinus]PXW89221.1 hydroxyethylthiazole kinase [Streptohalobacillus salinus]
MVTIERIRVKSPLVHSITNQVVMNFTANGLLALGARPVMADDRGEVAEMTAQSDALLINIGTLTERTKESMFIAGKKANECGIPIVLDPVGVGATAYRKETVRQLLASIDIALVKGNSSEIYTLCYGESKGRGVDADAAEDAFQLTKDFYRKYGTVALVTGEEDVLYTEGAWFVSKTGTKQLSLITGTGCLLGAVIASFLAVDQDVTKVVLEAVSFYTVASERAEKNSHGPGSFQMHMLDALHHLSVSEWEADKQTVVIADV